MKIKVSVTQEHIARGERGNRTGCPVALAMHDAGYPNVDVCPAIYLDANVPSCIHTPRAVIEFATAFDKGYAVEPFTFELEIP